MINNDRTTSFNFVQGCMPYSIKPCVSSSKQKDISCINSNNTKSEKCYAKCTNEKYPISYKDDKYYGKDE